MSPLNTAHQQQRHSKLLAQPNQINSNKIKLLQIYCLVSCKVLTSTMLTTSIQIASIAPQGAWSSQDACIKQDIRAHCAWKFTEANMRFTSAANASSYQSFIGQLQYTCKALDSAANNRRTPWVLNLPEQCQSLP